MQGSDAMPEELTEQMSLNGASVFTENSVPVASQC